MGDCLHPGFFNLLMVVTAHSQGPTRWLDLACTVNKLAGLSIVYISASLSSIVRRFSPVNMSGSTAQPAMVLTEGVMARHVQLLLQRIFR